MSSNCTTPGIIGLCLTRLSTAQAIGLTFDVEAGLASFLAVVIFLLFVARNIIRNYRNPPPGGISLLRTHVDLYFLNLLVFEVLHGLAAAMGANWLHRGEVYCGTYCTLQGAIRNVGSTGVALTTLAITVHTFFVIFFQWIPPRSLLLPSFVVSLIWALFATQIIYQLLRHNAPEEPFFTPTPYWCWISPRHPATRIWGQYLWQWTAAFVSILLYGMLYFCVRGNVAYDPDYKWKIHFSKKPSRRDTMCQSSSAQNAMMDAMCMLYYPVAYTLLVLPNSIVRFLGESLEAEGKRVPFAATLTASVIFGLSGVVNVFLFVLTRPNLLLFRFPASSPIDRYTYKLTKMWPAISGPGSMHGHGESMASPPSTATGGKDRDSMIAGSPPRPVLRYWPELERNRFSPTGQNYGGWQETERGPNVGPHIKW